MSAATGVMASCCWLSICDPAMLLMEFKKRVPLPSRTYQAVPCCPCESLELLVNCWYTSLPMKAMALQYRWTLEHVIQACL